MKEDIRIKLGLNEDQANWVDDIVARIIDYTRRFMDYQGKHYSSLYIISSDFPLPKNEDDLALNEPRTNGKTIQIRAEIFPKVPESGCYYSEYRPLLDPDNYGYTHDVLDYVNEKLNEAIPNHNLWCVALDFDWISVFDLDIVPERKRY